MSNFRPGGFSVLPTVVKNLLIINVLFFLATMAAESVYRINLSDYLGLHYIESSGFQPYQFVTYMFMHGSFAHLFFNMFALWMFGNTLENIWGSNRFLLFYFICGIGAGFVQELVQFFQYGALHNYEGDNYGGMIIPVEQFFNMIPTTVGASGAIYGILLAFGMMFPNSTLYIYFAIPIKAKWFVLIYGVIELFSGLSGTADGIAHFAHLGGMLFGLILILYWKKKGNLY